MASDSAILTGVEPRLKMCVLLLWGVIAVPQTNNKQSYVIYVISVSVMNEVAVDHPENNTFISKQVRYFFKSMISGSNVWSGGKRQMHSDYSK